MLGVPVALDLPPTHSLEREYVPKNRPKARIGADYKRRKERGVNLCFDPFSTTPLPFLIASNVRSVINWRAIVTYYDT